MSRTIRGALRRVAVAALAGVLGGCATLSAPAAWQPGNLTPLIIGWQQYFRIQWTATPAGGGTLVDGYITNTWGFPAQRVRVLVTGYDAAGRQVGSWSPGVRMRSHRGVGYTSTSTCPQGPRATTSASSPGTGCRWA